MTYWKNNTTSSGAQTVVNASIASTVNTTTTPKNAGTTYTGTWERNEHPDIRVNVQTDQSGTLYIDYSNDAGVTTFTVTSYSIAAGTFEQHTLTKGYLYSRVRFTNTSVSNQTYLRLYTYYGQFGQDKLPLSDSVASDSDSIISKSVAYGKTSAGSYVNIPATDDGQLLTVQGSVKSAIGVNSTITPLNAAATFTGTAELNVFPDVAISCKTDQDGILYYDFSNDGTNWDTFPSSGFVIYAGAHEAHKAVKGARYFRARFTNTSASNQTYLRMYTYYGSFGQLNAPANSTIASDNDSTVVRPLDFNLIVAEGLYQNRITVFKDGINPDIDTGSTPEDIWDAGGTYTGFPVGAGAAASAVSTNAGDTGTLYFAYLASPTSEVYITASVTLNGTTPVSLGVTVWRCNFAYYDSGNDTTFNLGDISIYHTATPANIFVGIRTGYSQSFCAAYTVPYNCKAYFDRITGTLRGGASSSADGYLWYRPYGLSPRLRQTYTLNFGSIYFDDVDYLFQVPALTDFIPRINFVSANNTNAQVSFRIILVRGG